MAAGRPPVRVGAQPGVRDGARRGAAAGVVAKALTLLMLSVGVGAYHSVRRPITLRMAPVETTTIRLPGPGGANSAQPPAEGETEGQTEGQATEGEGEQPVNGASGVSDPAAGTEPASDPGLIPGAGPPASDPPAGDPDVLVLEQFISLETAHRLWEAGAAEFIDARHLEEFSLGHIPRANLYDPRTMYSATPEWANWLDFESSILVIYCDGGLCDASQNAVRQMQGLGFKRLHIMEDGFPAWKGAGHAVDVGEPGATAPAEPQ